MRAAGRNFIGRGMVVSLGAAGRLWSFRQAWCGGLTHREPGGESLAEWRVFSERIRHKSLGLPLDAFAETPVQWVCKHDKPAKGKDHFLFSATTSSQGCDIMLY
jgi:hypothetical protein